MSRVSDPSGNEFWIEEVQRYCLEQLTEFESSRRGVFGWPMDRISDQPYGYAIHCSIVEDWNREGRQTDCITFTRTWLQDEENIKRAIQRKWD